MDIFGITPFILLMFQKVQTAVFTHIFIYPNAVSDCKSKESVSNLSHREVNTSETMSSRTSLSSTNLFAYRQKGA